ncbi:MAG: hypothetical protein FIA95_01115, partial [Gemmatimonadetes bacterium]|nr:hypothetical protein [Gemmatimonadota bacterium]
MTARAWWSRWEPRSIHDKLAVPFAVVIGLIALSVSLYFPRTMELREVAALKARGRSVAEITAFSLQSALVFGDVGDMREGVLGAFTVSEIARVRVFDRSGSLLTEVTRDGGAGGEVTSAPAAGEADLLEAAADVISPDGARLGNVVVHLSQAQLHRDVAALRTTVQVVSAVIFLVGVLSLLILGRILTRPLFRIVETAEAVATGDLFLA